MGETIFSKIVKKEIPADIVFENDNVLAFRDINPQAPTHILIIPKVDDFETIKDVKGTEHAQLIGEMIDTANKLAEKEGIAEEGYRLVFNCGPNGGQEVYHLHLHLLGGRQMQWPPG